MPTEKLNENCGICAVYLKKPIETYPLGGVVYFLHQMMLQLQHRGQLSAGFTSYDPLRNELLKTHKGNGLVNEVFGNSDALFAQKLVNEFGGTAGIGHTRYATAGTIGCEEAQPFERAHNRTWKWFSMAFNGNIANAKEMQDELKSHHYFLRTTSDTEVLMHKIAQGLGADSPAPLPSVFEHMQKDLDGSYNIVFLNALGELVVARDPMGFKPLCYANTPDFFLAASESVALFPFVRTGIEYVQPGEMIILHQNGEMEKKRFAAQNTRMAHCMFEWIYFASPGSNLEGKNVYETRWRLGEELARVESLPVNSAEYVVVCVPETSKPAADGYAYALSLPSKDGLLRNRYVGRTFIEAGSWGDRVHEKFSINRAAMQGKKVILVEDSIVRGNTMKELVQRVREEGGAKEVHARISCPPILNPCFYGIDMSSFSELIAVKHFVSNPSQSHREMSGGEIAQIKRELGVDSLLYQSWDGLLNALQIGQNKLCLACLNGEYLTPHGKKLSHEAFARDAPITSKEAIYSPALGDLKKKNSDAS